MLSAYLDGELTPDRAGRRGSAPGRLRRVPSDLEAEAEVRRLVRDLPAVDPPFGFYERILRDGPGAGARPRRKRRLRFGLANIAGAVAVLAARPRSWST